MTARTQIGAVWVVPTDNAYDSVLIAPARTIAAGSLVRCFIRGEDGDSTIVGSDTELADWNFIKVRDSNVTGWLGYSWNHPGGTDVVITITFGTSQGFRSATFVEHTGGDTVDPYQAGSLATSVGGSSGMDLSVPFTGAVSIFGGQVNYNSTSYTAVNGVLLGSSNYHACLIINSTSSSPANPKISGSVGGTASIAAAFSDPPDAADTTPPTLSGATLTATSATASTGGVTTNEAGPAWAVTTTSATQPSTPQVKAGQDHTGATAPSDTATLSVGANPAAFAFTGQTTGATYYLHVVQDDDADTPNTSAVESSAGEVIAAPTTITVNTLVFTEGENIRMRMALAAGLRTGGCTLIWREKRIAQTDYSGGDVFSDGTGSWDSGAWTALFVTHGCDGTYDSTGQRSTGASTPMYHEIAGLDSAAYGSANDYIASNSSLGTQVSYPAQYGVWVERAVTINPNGSVLEHVNYVDFSDPTKVIKQNIATSDPVTPTNQYLDFGAPHWITNGSEDFSGEMTHRKVFSRALSESEIRQELDNFSDTPVVSDCWYSNYSPTAADISDKKPSGTAHPYVWNNGTATDSTAVFDLPATETPRTETTTVSLAIQAARSASASMGLAVQAPQSSTTSIDLAVRAARSAAADLTTAVQKAGAASALVQLAVQASSQQTTGANLVVQQAQSAAAGLDLAVQQAQTASAGVGMAVQGGQSAVASLSAAVQLARSASASLALAVQEARSASASVSLQVQAPSQQTVGVDLMVQADASASLGASVAVLIARTLAVPASIAVQTPLAQAVAASVAVQAGKQASTGVSLLVQGGFEASAGVDMAVQQAASASAGVGVAVQLGQIASAGAQMAVQEARSSGVGVGLMVQGDYAVSAALQVAVQFAASASAAVSAAVQRLASASVGVSVAVQVQQLLGASIDAAVRHVGVAAVGVSLYVRDDSAIVWPTGRLDAAHRAVVPAASLRAIVPASAIRAIVPQE
jgi:hypothetical protein